MPLFLFGCKHNESARRNRMYFRRKRQNQKLELENKYENLNEDDIQTIVFSEDDVVEAYLRENDISKDDVDLESLRDLQHAMINEIET